MALSRDDILAADDIKVETVPVPEWGGDVCVRVMSGAERDGFVAWREKANQADVLQLFQRRFCALVLCDENGAPLFAEDDISKLAGKSAVALDRVLKAGMALNGISDDAEKELEKNSDGTPNDDAGSS